MHNEIQNPMENKHKRWEKSETANGITKKVCVEQVENGYVIGVQIVDRSKKYDTLPEILIVGGDVAGAKVLPNLFCLDIEELERRGYAKIGTGKYIDCP